MAFEDRYYQSKKFGLLTLRYQPVDETLMPVAAIAKAQEVPGRFCVAKVAIRQGYQIKRCLTAEKFSAMKGVLLTELNVSVAKMEPEVSRVLVMEGSLKASPHTTTEMFQKFVFDDLTPAFQAKRTAVEMISAINYWEYENGLCDHVALANCVK